MEFLKWGQKQVRQFALNLTDTEVLVEEATNNDPWGPHGRDMAKISEAALDPDKYREVMSVIARRLTDAPENWRHVYKALLLLEYLVKHGPMKVARDTVANTSLLTQLQCFDFKDDMGRDHGLNVRNRSKELLALVSDTDRLEAARESARVNRGKYTGTSKEESKFRTATGSYNYSQSIPKRVVYEDKPEEKVEDPFEATRKRIEKLKAEKEAPMKLRVPRQKETKKLSQVKLNPDIAKTFMKPGQLPASSTEEKSIEEAPASFQAASDPMDLLGDLTDDRISTHSAPAATMDAFDALTDPISDQPIEGGDDWAAFQESPAKMHNQPSLAFQPQIQPTSHQEIPLTDLLSQEGEKWNPFQTIKLWSLGPGVQSIPNLAPPSVPKPSVSRVDPFADLCLPSQKTVVPMGKPKSQTAGPSAMPPQEAPAWQPPSLQQQSTTASNGFQMTGLTPQPGAPMNPNAVQPQRMPQKIDPFANLGF